MSFWVEVIMLIVCPIPYYDFIVEVKAINSDKNGNVSVYYLLSDF